jgi:hypothetical protein
VTLGGKDSATGGGLDVDHFHKAGAGTVLEDWGKKVRPTDEWGGWGERSLFMLKRRAAGARGSLGKACSLAGGLIAKLSLHCQRCLNCGAHHAHDD